MKSDKSRLEIIADGTRGIEMFVSNIEIRLIEALCGDTTGAGHELELLH